MEIKTLADVDAFLDKFYDPTFEISRILQALGIPEDNISTTLMHKLLMKSYRLGKEHGYSRAMDVIRNK